MKKILVIFGLAILIGVAADAALVCSSSAKAKCDQEANVDQTINVCNMTNVTINNTGGGTTVFGGCTAIVTANQSVTQYANCLAKAGC